jgi:hypothetical protein
MRLVHKSVHTAVTSCLCLTGLGAAMAKGDHFSEAERLSRDAHAPGLAQVHATLAVAEQLAKVAEALDMLIRAQQDG